MKHVEIKGIIPPIVTPMNEDESINEEELRKQIDRQIEAGVHGVFVYGTNGEFFALTQAEKERILEIAVDQVNHRVPVYAGTGCITNVYSESGTIEAAESYEVKRLVRGDVLTAGFEEGDTVQEGDVLYTIDSADAANSVERARLTLSQAQRDYEDAVAAGYVTTDISGTVVSISVAQGNVVAAGQEVATIRDDSTMLLTLDFPAADAAGFAAGQEALVTLDGTYETVSGTVRSVSGTDTLSSGNMLVHSVTIAVPNAGGLTASQAATASVNGVSALGSARLSSQKTQTLTAASSGTVAALCVQPGSWVASGSKILQLESDSLTRQVETASDNLRSAELSMEDTENTLDDYTITAPHQRHRHHERGAGRRDHRHRHLHQRGAVHHPGPELSGNPGGGG